MKNIFYLIVITLFYSCTTHKTFNNSKQEFYTFENNKIYFNYPKNWIEVDLDLKNEKVISFAPKRTIRKFINFNYSSAYLNFISSDYDSIKSNNFLNNTKSKIIKRTPNHVILLSKTLVKSDTENSSYIDLNHTFINNGKRYILNYHCEEIMYKKYLTDFEMIINSFKIKEIKRDYLKS